MTESPLVTKSASPRRTTSATLDAMGGVASSVSHQYNNLLMVIRNCAALLRDDLADDDPRKTYVLDLLVAADRAARLTSQLQAFAHTRLCQTELVRPAEIIRGMSETLRHLVPEDVDFRVSIRGTACTVLFDPVQLQSVLLNLIARAADEAGARGRIFLTVAEEAFEEVPSREGSTLTGRHVCIALASYRSGNTRTARARRDARLANVIKTIRDSGGTVDTLTDPDGASFLKIYLPIRHDDRPPLKLKPMASQPRSLEGCEVVLLVEDDADVRNTVRSALERYGYTVMDARDGSEALRMTDLFGTPPDLLLTDIVMPELTGGELIDALRAGGRLPKVLLMSGYADAAVLERSQPVDRYPLIRKPFTHNELATRVRELLDGEPQG